MSPGEDAIHVEARAREAAAPPASPAAEPCTLVIFGVSGDLAHRKLAPALLHLQQAGLLPERFAIVGCSRRPAGDEELRASLRIALEARAGATTVTTATGATGSPAALDAAAWARFAPLVHHVAGDFDAPDTYRALRARLEQLDAQLGTGGNRLYYLATPPASYPQVLRGLHEHALLRPAHVRPWTRVVIEKPFGQDLKSAQDLNALVGVVLDERQTFRIDHFLGKETVQNILVFRFGNSLFEPVWNRKCIDHVEITAAEPQGVQGRGRFYDGVGVVRDMLQNHLLQVLALVAMELPLSFRADDVRDARVQLFRSLRPLLPYEVEQAAVFGQYAGYGAERDVAPGSRTPTYAALAVHVENWRWQGVPFFLRSGKRLAAHVTEVAIHFQPIPLCLFGSDEVCRQVAPNVLRLRIQPDEGITLRFASKRPGEELDVAAVDMDFSYARAFGAQTQDAYQRLLLDALRGDATLFARRDEIEHCWRFVQPLLDAWERPEGAPLPLHPYAPGSAGPAAADELLRRGGRMWSRLGPRAP
jgi:glucose-6-phosphate 1-dehydrogenase